MRFSPTKVLHFQQKYKYFEQKSFQQTIKLPKTKSHSADYQPNAILYFYKSFPFWKSYQQLHLSIYTTLLFLHIRPSSRFRMPLLAVQCSAISRRVFYLFSALAHSRRVISHSIPLQSPLRSYSLLQIGIVEWCGVYLLFWLPLVLLYRCALASLLSVLPIAISQLHMLQNTLLEV